MFKKLSTFCLPIQLFRRYQKENIKLQRLITDKRTPGENHYRTENHRELRKYHYDKIRNKQCSIITLNSNN